MKIIDKKIKVRDLVEGFNDNGINGIFGYGGKLNIRPPYQREFIYNDIKQSAVIESISKGWPLSDMYWVENENGTFELLDGQQRTISICKYFKGGFSVDYRGYINLDDYEKEKFLNYEINVHICKEGTEKEKLEWFQVINIAGEKLTKQELRNALYTGTWISDAKRHFAKQRNSFTKYIAGSPIRQDILEKVLRWKAEDEGLNSIEALMSIHQHDKNAKELWDYYKRILYWVTENFPTYNKVMKNVEWGSLFNKWGDKEWNFQEINKLIEKLLMDEDVTQEKGIYSYVFDRNEKHLSIRTFAKQTKRRIYKKQKGICSHCKKHFEIGDMQADHIIPWSKGGKTVEENCQMLCAKCNNSKSDRSE